MTRKKARPTAKTKSTRTRAAGIDTAHSRDTTNNRPTKALDGRVEVHPATVQRWPDLVSLFGPKGACAGCWCMLWRRTQAEYNANKGEGNKRGLEQLVKSDRAPGLLGYVDGEPAGWCAIAPRSEYPRLSRSRVLSPVDGTPVWSVTCFFVKNTFRQRGLSVRLLRDAVRFAASQGARVVEGYPIDPSGKYADSFAFVGLAAAFEKAGFKEVARRSPTRPIMRIRCK